MNTTGSLRGTRRERGTGRIFYKGKTLWIQFYDASGRQRRESIAPELKALSLAGRKIVDPLKVAEQLLRKRIGAKENGILPSLKKSRVTVSELYDDEFAYLMNCGKDKTATWLKSRWDLRLNEHFGARRASEVRLADFAAYQTLRMEH